MNKLSIVFLCVLAVIIGCAGKNDLTIFPLQEFESKVKGLIKQLSAEEWEIREGTQKELIKLGDNLIWMYRKANVNDKAEVMHKIKQFADALNETTESRESEIRMRIKYIRRQIYPLTRPKIAFRSMRNSDKRKIYLMDEDGQNQIKLTATNEYESNAFWSPDGTRIAFITEYYTIFVDKWILNTIDADGRNHIRLTDSEIEGDKISWSPDSAKIAFAAEPPDGLCDIYLIDANGKNQVNLTRTPDAADESPDWSPDGAKIAYESRVHWNASDICVIDTDGENLIRLTKTERSWERHPVWSPDGTKIAYIAYDSNKEDIIYLFVMDANGQNQSRLARISQEGKCYDVYPSWSPDGTRIAVHSERDRKITICVISADGKNQLLLTPNEKSDIIPEWSPDGTKIVFESHRDGAPKIYVYDMELDGNNQKRLSGKDNHDEYPTWQPMSLSYFSALFKEDENKK
ncbi:MAG: PD40 domain-containing protein [Planctomycetes bacterium]|nr:PD40 domain-containing protein [Planctomycetota bacterium]